jgi:hypothetical protein
VANLASVANLDSVVSLAIKVCAASLVSVAVSVEQDRAAEIDSPSRGRQSGRSIAR